MSSSAIAIAPVVSLGGSTLSDAWQAALTEVRVELQFQVPGRCTLRFSDPGYVLLGGSTVSLGTTVDVKDADNSTSLFSGEVTAVSVEQRLGEQPEMVVVAHDKSHRLGRATTAKAYVSMTYSDIVSSLAGNCGLSPDVSSTSLTLDYIMQADSDLGFLTELARRVGYDWWADGTSLYFKAPASGSTVDLTLGTDLRSFSVRASGHGPDSVTVDGWDRNQQQMVTGQASSASSGVSASSTLADLVASPSSAFGSAAMMSAGLSAQSQTEATELSQAILDRAAACAVSATGVTAGNAKIKLGVTASISQAGPASGTYPVTRVEHIFRPATGYITRFHAGDRRPTTLVDSLATSRSVQSNATLRMGLTVGQVTNINDPNNTGRVKVLYPGLSSQYETGWARVVGIGGGANRGNVFIPEVNDEVLVGFEGNDPRQPVVIGGLYGSTSTMPSTTISDGKVQARGMTSRLGHVVSLLDGNDQSSQAILMALAGGNTSLRLGADKVSMTVPSGTAIEIVAGNSSIKFGTDGSVTIAAPTISLNADQQLNLKGTQVALNGDAQMSLQSNGTASFQGATVSITSNGPLSASGQPVSIN